MVILTECVSDFGGAALLPPHEAREHMLIRSALRASPAAPEKPVQPEGSSPPNSRGREQDFPRGVLALNRLSRS